MKSIWFCKFKSALARAIASALSAAIRAVSSAVMFDCSVASAFVRAVTSLLIAVVSVLSAATRSAAYAATASEMSAATANCARSGVKYRFALSPVPSTRLFVVNEPISEPAVIFARLFVSVSSSRNVPDRAVDVLALWPEIAETSSFVLITA